MILQIKVKIRIETLKEFAAKLMMGQLDRSAIISETYCEKIDPSVGISYWKVDDMEEFENKIVAWKEYYETIEVKEVITAKDAAFALLTRKK
jgi:hypothetical protein